MLRPVPDRNTTCMSQRTSKICWNYYRHNALWEIKNYLNGGVRNEGTKKYTGGLKQPSFRVVGKDG